MIHRIGVLLVVAAFASTTSASPPCVCTREMKPVCGSDGQTYSNLCLLRCQQQANPDLDVQSHGHCRNVREAGSDEADIEMSKLDCLCTLEYAPVCGSDGRTYPNKCAVGCYGSSPDVKILHQGQCSDARRKREACLVCPANYVPVCGTNGKTYGNPCTLACSGEDVEVAYQGECRNKRQAAAQRACICPYNYLPVCGTDGQSYGNECSLKCNNDVQVAYRGVCREKRQACFCPFNYAPVCGTDGQTYGNECALNCEGNVQIAHRGACRSRREVDRESVQVAALPSCVCSREARPVCGTDGRTYSNPCLLNCLREQNEDLHILHPGRCKNQVKVRDVNSGPGCSCARNFEPVCASNGQTYSNECLMQCAGSDLVVENHGPCNVTE